MKTQVIVSPSSNGKTTQGIGLVMSALVTPTQPLVALDRGGNYRSLVKYVPDLVYIGLNPGQALPALNRSTSVAIVEFAHRPGMDEETIHYVLETLASLPSPRVLVDDCHTYSKSFLLSLTEIASETIFLTREIRNLPASIRPDLVAKSSSINVTYLTHVNY